KVELTPDVGGLWLHHVLTVCSHDGRRLVLDGDFSMWEEDLVAATQLIEREVNSRLLQAARERFEAGHTQRFGVISVRSGGLDIAGRHLTYKSIDRIRVEGGKVIALLHGGPAAVPVGVDVSDVDNLSVLLELLHDCAGVPVEVQSLARWRGKG